MMTKDEYLELINKPEIPMDVWYNFFLEKGGDELGLEEFTARFKAVTQNVPRMVIGTDKAFKWVSMDSALRKFHEHYREKFEL